MQFCRTGDKFGDDLTEYFLKTYDRNGNLIYYGMSTERKVVATSDRTVSWVESRPEEEKIIFNIHSYSLDPWIGAFK